MKRTRFTESQIIAILREGDSGVNITELCRKHGISNATYYKWKSKYGGLEASDLKRLKELEAENSESAIQEINQKYNLSPEIQDGVITFSVPNGDTFLPEFIRSFAVRLLSISVRRPTLDDVFLNLTGHAIRDQEVGFREQMRAMMGHL